jgi:hypothetical protein
VAALTLGAFMVAFGPTLFPGIVGWLVNIASVVVGLTLWWRILERQPTASDDVQMPVAS